MPGDVGFLYMELTGSGGSETEGGLQYNSDISVQPHLNVNGTDMTSQMTNFSVKYGCGQELVVWAGATIGDLGEYFVEVGQLPGYINPEDEWVNSQIVSLDNAAWMFTQTPSDINGIGTDGAGAATPCMSCSIAKVASIAQQVQTYSVDGSYFGVSGANQNSILWDQLAFGDWNSDCIPGTTLCTFLASADPTDYYAGPETYPSGSFISQSSMSPNGYGPYESYDGISLNGSRGQSERVGISGYSEPLPPMPCTADSDSNCALVDRQIPNGACDTGIIGPHGSDIYVDAYKITYSIYRKSSWPRYRETAVASQRIPSKAPCTISTAWSPGEPRVQYDDPNLP
jgi:hypothetical protein